MLFDIILNDQVFSCAQTPKVVSSSTANCADNRIITTNYQDNRVQRITRIIELRVDKYSELRG